jgi:predicted ester cyclase
MALLALPAVLASGAPAPPAPAGAAAGKPPPAASAAPSTPAATPDHRQENKALVRRYLTEVLAQGHLDNLDAIVAKTFVDLTPGAPNLRGPTAVRQARLKVSTLFTQVEYDLQELVAEDDRVAARYLVLALPKPEPAKPAPRPLAINGMAIFHVRTGRIQDVYVINDQANMLRQLGYTLVPPGSRRPVPGGDSPPPKAGSQPPNAGSPPPNAGSPPPNAAAPTQPNASPPPSTAGQPQSNASPPPSAAGQPRSCAGSPPSR